ncbi:hypothetical protein R5R35_012538 [Gryllus longicercus]|uniref:Chromosome transmission fidelity protein 8 homolog n=1 Tax=Gryllus longicercus TaxID=2509291 RepID=A0AAN9Z162_9ORTH
MPIVIKICEEGRPAEWAIIELQGDLESRGEGTFCSQFIGDLHFTKNNVPVLIVGHHILYGKEVKMEKPFAVLEKHILDTQSHNDEKGAVDDFHVEYIVKAVIKKKLLFKTRPKPIIANVPKIV